ncbi:unnamed protein product, partial [Gulo gulo]
PGNAFLRKWHCSSDLKGRNEVAIRKAKKHTPKQINSGKAWEGRLGTRCLDDSEQVKNSIRNIREMERGGALVMGRDLEFVLKTMGKSLNVSIQRMDVI